MKRCLCYLTLLLLATVLEPVNARLGQPPKANVSGPELFEKMRAKYAALKSYSDTGTITTESAGPGAAAVAIVERHSFTTFYRAPRQFFFEFVKDPKVGEERFVVWADGADFNTWWSETKVHDTYPKGQGATAFALATFPTKGSIMQISPLLFSQAGLHGPVVDLKVLKSGEVESVDGRRCYKASGEVALAYGTGAVTSVRPTTIWIDAETFLVRKIVEDTSSGTSASVDRITTTFSPQADTDIDGTHFEFAVPNF